MLDNVKGCKKFTRIYESNKNISFILLQYKLNKFKFLPRFLNRCGALHVGDEILTINKMTLEYTTLPEVYQLMRNSSNGQIHLEIMPYSQLKDRRPSAYANLADHLYLANRGLKTSPLNGRKKQIVSVAVNKNGSEQKSKGTKIVQASSATVTFIFFVQVKEK